MSDRHTEYKFGATLIICVTAVAIFALMADCEKHRHDVNVKTSKYSRSTVNNVFGRQP